MGSGERNRWRVTMVLTMIAIVSRSSNSLAFDVSSRSSSSFTTSSNYAQIIFHPQGHESWHGYDQQSNCPLQMKVSSSGKSRTRDSKSSHLIELNNERLKTAGRRGTKKFVDPNKVFLGNLPYDAVESDVYTLFANHWNIPLESVGDRIESIKIIRDWKTGKSKGYGFVQFYEPMAATSAMESINKGTSGKWRIKGRRIRLDQGKRKEDPEEEANRRKKKKKELKLAADLDEEGMVIHSALADVEAGVGADGSVAVTEDDNDDSEFEMSEDDMIAFIEKGGLREVMPLTEETAGFLGIEGIYDDQDDDYFKEYYNENGYDDDDFKDLEEDMDDDDDGEEIVYDGVFEEEYNPKEYETLSKEEEEEVEKMNREQRRAADKKRKKRKLPFKGFGSPSK
mmetsp:Transcript_24251/g.50813  ORF Transcript_24251/g.50813 Transcript_24251/m.50813 type:complete len:396 (-) Transcript_24251:39-1226(-)